MGYLIGNEKMTNPPIFLEKVKQNMIWVVQASLQKMIKNVMMYHRRSGLPRVFGFKWAPNAMGYGVGWGGEEVHFYPTKIMA